MSESFKMLVTADLHLSNTLPHARTQADGLTDRFSAQLQAMEQMVDLARKHRVDAVVIAGDLYDRRTVDALTLRHSLGALVRFAPVGVLVVPGNHEAHSDGSERYLPEYFEETGHEHISFFSSEDVVEPLPWLCLHALPYTGTSRVEENLQAIRDQIASEDPGRQKRHLLFAHVAVQGARVGAWASDVGVAPSLLEQGFDWVFLGHYHVPQALTARCECIGSPWQLNFGESEVPGEVLVVEVFEGKRPMKVERVRIEAPRFHTFKAMPPEELPMGWEKAFDSGDYVRVELEVTHAELAERKAALEPMRSVLEEAGVHFRIIHRPVYHHEDRLGRESGEAVLSLEELVSGYPDLAVSGIPTGELREMGLEFLRRAREEGGR